MLLNVSACAKFTLKLSILICNRACTLKLRVFEVLALNHLRKGGIVRYRYIYTFATSSFASSITWKIIPCKFLMGLSIGAGIDVCITPASIIPVVVVTTVELTFRSFTPFVTFTSTRASCGYNIWHKFGVVFQTYR